MLALFVGPAGVALVGNLRSFVFSLEAVSTFGFQNGIIKLIAENKDDNVAAQRIFATAFYSLLSVSLVYSAVLFFSAGYWTTLLFGDKIKTIRVIQITALALPWYAMGVFLTAVINGLGKYRHVIYASIVGNVIGLAFSVYAVVHFGTFGALLSIVVPPALLFFVACYFLGKELSFFRSISLGKFDQSVLRSLASYSVMTLVTAVAAPIVYLLLRTHLIETSGYAAAGFVEAISRLSSYYMLFISTILTVYFLPKLSLADNRKATRNVFKSYYSGLLPVFTVGLVAVYLLRMYLIQMLFTEEFLPVSDLFFWQLFGDFFKAASLILGYQFFAKRLTLAFVVTELFSHLTMLCVGYGLIGLYGAKGVVIAHALTYVVYFVVLVVYFRKNLFLSAK